MSNAQAYTRATEGDTFDLIAMRLYGRTAGVTEQIVAANPQITQKSPILSAGTGVYLPQNPIQKTEQQVTLWT